MAIINCPECTHKISDQSVSCTNCGFPTSKMNFLIKNYWNYQDERGEDNLEGKALIIG